MIKSHPGLIVFDVTSKHERSRLLARLRETAFPTERPAAMANLEKDKLLVEAINIINGLVKEIPVRFSRWISVERVRQFFRFTHLPILSFN
jgi:hypothetical protein